MKNKILKILILMKLIVQIEASFKIIKEYKNKDKEYKDKKIIFPFILYYNNIINSKKLIVSSKIDHDETLEGFFDINKFIFPPKKKVIESDTCYYNKNKKWTQNFFIYIDSAPFWLDNNNMAIERNIVFLANYIKKYKVDKETNKIIPFVYIEEICVNRELMNKKFGTLSFVLLLKKIFNNNKISHTKLCDMTIKGNFILNFILKIKIKNMIKI